VAENLNIPSSCEFSVFADIKSLLVTLADSSRNDSSASSGTNGVTNRPVTTYGHPNTRKQMSIAEVTSSAGSTPDVDNSSTNDDSSSSGSSSDESDDHSEESSHAPICSVTTKPRRIEVHQFSKPAKNRLVGFVAVSKTEHVGHQIAFSS
jgi:hypothetical protein